MNFKRNIWVVVCLAIFTGVISWQTMNRFLSRIGNDFFHPYLTLPVKAEKILSDGSLLLENKEQLAAAVVQLRNENRRLLAENASSRRLQEENRELRKLMNLARNLPGKAIFSDIIIRDPLSWNEQFTIGKGTDDGIVEGDLVLAFSEEKNNLALVGRIVWISRHNAGVATLFNQDQRFSVTLPEAGALGVLQGGFRKDHQFVSVIQWLPKEYTFRIGETVVTSGLGNTEIPGVAVGTVADFDGTGRAAMLRNRLYKEAYVELDTNFETLKTVLVLVR